MANNGIVELDDENFEERVLNAETPVLVDFWAPWCGPCKMIAPVLEELAEEYADKLKIGKVNVDKQQQLATRYGVRSIPTLILFKTGEAAQEIIGVKPKTALKETIDANL